MKSSSLIAERINRLTSDEDLRQELWIYYLEGNEPDTFPQYLKHLKLATHKQEAVDTLVDDLIKQPFSKKLSDVLTNFTRIENSVLFMLLIGCNTEDMSSINAISNIRIKQMIQNIKSNTNWNMVRK